MKVGFTGTRAGMSAIQKQQLATVLRWLNEGDAVAFTELHHGMAVGADMEAETIAKANGWYVVKRHPASGKPLARNRQIVAACDVLIAAPRTDQEELRSGTWATVRYARQAGKPVVMLSRGKE